MKKNVGGRDRAVRLLLGPLLLLAGTRAQGRLASAVATTLGLALVASGVFERSLLNRLRGIDTYESAHALDGEPIRIEELDDTV